MSEHDGTPAYLLDDKSELRDDWFKGIDTVLVTAGASAPDDLVQDVLNELTQRYNGHVDESELIKENVKFALPVQLRIFEVRDEQERPRLKKVNKPSRGGAVLNTPLRNLWTKLPFLLLFVAS